MPRKRGPSLVNAYLKASRAKVHLDALRHEIDVFCNTQPCALFRKEDPKRGRYYLRAKLPATPDTIPLILGDLLYCLRSSLDQLTWSLAKLTLPYPEGTQFPIFAKLDKNTRRKFKAYTTGVPLRAVKLIESLQPYHRANPSAHLLWRLNLLCNIDKHRRIPVHGDETVFHFPGVPPHIGSHVEGDPDQQMASLPLEFKSYLEVEPVVTFNVVFGDMAKGLSCDLDGITKIYDFVANSVIPRFGRFFR